MNKQSITLLTLFFTLVSCASLPPRQDPQECIIALKVKFENNTPFPAGRSIQLYFSEELPPMNIQPENRIYYIKGVRKAGIILTKAVLTMESGFKGEPYRKDAEITLPYEPGTITVLPYEIRYNQYGYKKATNTYSSNIGFFELNQQQIDAVWEKLRKEEHFGTWTSP